MIHRWKPWEKSTGPKSEEGKRRSAMRGYKGGQREQLREVARLLREQAEGLNQVAEWLEFDPAQVRDATGVGKRSP